MNVNAVSALALIADLYAQLNDAHAENQHLQGLLAERTSPPSPS